MSTLGKLTNFRRTAHRIAGIGLLCLTVAGLLSACADNPSPKATSLPTDVPLVIPTNAPPVIQGRLLWRFRASSLVLDSPVVADGVVYASARDDRLYAVDAATGDLRWRTQIASHAYMAVEDDVVFVGSGSYLYAVDAATGTTLWNYRMGSTTYSTPAVADGVVYMASLDRNLYAVDADTGDLRWRYESGGGGIRSSPAVSEGVVYVVSSWNGHLHAVDVDTGNPRWQYETNDRNGHYYSPAAADGVVYFPTDSYLYAVDATTGSLLWQVEQSVKSDSTLAIADGVVFLISSWRLVAVDPATGSTLWEYRPGDIVDSSPAVADGVVYIGSRDRYLHAVDAASGKGVWRYRTGGQIYSTPAVAAGVVYFGSADDHLYALSTAPDVPAQASTPTPTPVAGLAKLIPNPPSIAQDILRVFGVAVAISRDGMTIAVGDTKKTTDRKYDGAVYVFTRETEDWSDLGEDASANLLPPDDNEWNPVPDDRDWVEFTESFGRAVAISADGSTVIVGAPEHLPHGYNSGAAYVFTRPSDGWGTTLPDVATLTASDGMPLDRFGDSVAMSADGQTVVVGSSGWDYDRLSPGAAYVFAKPSGGWTDVIETAKLTVSDGTDGDEIGTSVAVSGDGGTVIVGASTDTLDGVRSGAVYIFTRRGSEWVDATEAARLAPSDGTEDDRFGNAIVVSEDGGTVVVGAAGKDAYGEDHGAAYIFVRPEAGWADSTESAKLVASDGGSEDHFGGSLAISTSGASIIVGGLGHAHILERSGAAYVFIRPDGGWTDATETVELIHPSSPVQGSFGASVSVSGQTIVVGAPSSAVYVFNSFSAESR